jgi:hypothetical protein
MGGPPVTLYRIQLRAEDGASLGYVFYLRRRDAQVALKEGNKNPFPTDFQKIEVEVNALGILHALNRYGGHPNNAKPK